MDDSGDVLLDGIVQRHSVVPVGVVGENIGVQDAPVLDLLLKVSIFTQFPLSESENTYKL